MELLNSSLEWNFLRRCGGRAAGEFFLLSVYERRRWYCTVMIEQFRTRLSDVDREIFLDLRESRESAQKPENYVRIGKNPLNLSHIILTSVVFVILGFQVIISWTCLESPKPKLRPYIIKP